MIYEILTDLQNVENKRKDVLLKVNLPEEQNIEQLLINNSLIRNSELQLDLFVNNFNNSINIKELLFTKLKTAKNEYICTFDSPVFINQAKLMIDDFIFSEDNTSEFKVLFQTETNDFITKNMLPYFFFGRYIETIKFYDGQSKSLFSSKKTTLKKCYYQNTLLSNESIILGYTEDNKILFDTNHKRDEILVEYIPAGDEYVKQINTLVKSVKIKSDIELDLTKVRIEIV